jgi:hypothetical protein
VTLGLSAATGVLMGFDNTDTWANEDDAFLLLYTGKPVNDTINFFSGPYRYADQIAGDGTTAPTSPATLAVPFAYVADQKVFTRVRVSRADGRLSDVQLLDAIVSA